MEDHNSETRELEQTMERALAVAIAHGSSLVESWAKMVSKRRNRAHDTAADPATAPSTAGDVESAAAAVQRRARVDLAKGRPDAQFWLTASPDELVARFRAEAEAVTATRTAVRRDTTDRTIDPLRLGERAHDQRWARDASGAEVIGLLGLANRYSEDALVAANVRDNLCEQIRDLGLDPDELMRLDPAEAARLYQQRVGVEQHKDRSPDTDTQTTLTADGIDSVDRDGAHVAALLSQAQAADARAEHAEHNAELISERAGTPAATAASAAAPQMSRAERVAIASPTAPGRAAAIAARDHPTNPRAAAAVKPSSQPRAKTGRTMSADRQRGRGM